MPQCAVMGAGSKKRIQEHLDRGWRHVGVRQTWSGKFSPKACEPLEPKDREHYANLDFGFTGRLWRDPQVRRETAIEETRRFILKSPGFIAHGDGFAIVSKKGLLMTVDLAGSLDHSARRILTHAAFALGTKYMRAGTYEDNLAAQALYKKMGLRIVKREAVLHK